MRILKKFINFIIHLVISLLIGLLPYHFTHFLWYRRLLWFYYRGVYFPVNLWVLDEISLMYPTKNVYLDIYEYCEKEDLKL